MGELVTVGAPMGAWVIYDYDHGPYAIALHATCEQAAREAARQGYGRVAQWPFGVEFADAIKAWESREEER